jgi:hypothetical protein
MVSSIRSGADILRLVPERELPDWIKHHNRTAKAKSHARKSGATSCSALLHDEQAVVMTPVVMRCCPSAPTVPRKIDHASLIKGKSSRDDSVDANNFRKAWKSTKRQEDEARERDRVEEISHPVSAPAPPDRQTETDVYM